MSNDVTGHGTPTPRADGEAGPPRAAEAPAGDLSLPRVWLRLGWLAALIAAAASVVGLLVPGSIYGQETRVLADQAVAQDVINLLVVVPLLVVLGIGAARGSVRAYVCWLGCLAFTAYSYAIYAFAIHFGPLFLPWVAVLGLSFYALLGSLAAVDAAPVRRAFAGRHLPVMAWTLITLSVLFGLLWLREIVPDLLGRQPSTSAAALNLPTNPVHVLDLALFLPAALASGILLLRRKPIGYSTAPGVLVFMALTCLPILITPAVAITRGHDPSWTVLAPLGIVLAISAWVLRHALHNIRPPDVTTASSPAPPSAIPDPQTVPPRPRPTGSDRPARS